MTTTPPTPLQVAVARLEVKVDQLIATVRDQGKDIDGLKSRRLPLPAVTTCCAAVGAVGGIVAMVKGH